MFPFLKSMRPPRLLGDRRGNIALSVAAVASVLTLLGGGLLDVSEMSQKGGELQAALDAAALAGVKAANDYLNANGTSTQDVAAAMQLATTTAQQDFVVNNQNSGLTATTTQNATFDGAKTAVTMTVSAPYKTVFLGLIGMNQVTVSRRSVSEADYGHQYYQVVFLADISGSMGIGGTTAAITALETTPGFNGCAFACHDPYHYYSSTDYRALARTDNISLKVDYENAAINAFMTQLMPIADNYPSQFSVSIYTYATNFYTVYPPTVLKNSSVANAASAAAATIDMEPIGPANTNWGYTNTTAALKDVLSQLKNVGDGSSPTQMKTFLVFVSDGVEDTPNPGGPYGRVMDLTYTSACTALKNKGVSVFTIWTQYNTVNDAQWNYFIQPIQNQLSPTMQSCASNAQQYYNASDGPAIQAAVQQIFQSITSQANVRIKS